MSAFQTLINEIEEPEIHTVLDEECYICSIRKELVAKTPEETVRQKIIKYLITHKAVPEKMLRVGIKLSEYKVKSTLRADIVINKDSGDKNELLPLAIIECKAPNVMISKHVVKEVINYADRIEASYILVTNGIVSVVGKYDSKNDRWIRVGELPDYNALLDEMIIYTPRTLPWKRIPFYFLTAKRNLYRGSVFNDDTPPDLLAFLTNFWECLLDTSHKIPEKQYRRFRIIKDYGIRHLSCGNASGRGYYGPHRSFLVEDESGVRFMNLSIFDYGSHTIITASIDREKDQSHNSLQYSVDLIKMTGDVYTFNHNGRITIGKKGAGKVSELIELVAREAPELLVDGKVCLGKLTNNRLFYLSDPEVAQFVENVLSYAIVRDKYREMKLGSVNDVSST